MKRKIIGPLFITPLLLAIAAFTANAAPIGYTAVLTGPGESPPNNSQGTGTALVTLDLQTHMLAVNVTFQGLTGTTTASHIHTPTAAPFTGTAGVATTTPTFPGFPLGVMSGSYSQSFNTLDASTWNPAFVTANGGSLAATEAAFAAGLAAGEAYLNIHTSAFPGGEIRGFLVAAPDTFSTAWAGIAFLGLLVAARFRRKTA